MKPRVIKGSSAREYCLCSMEHLEDTRQGKHTPAFCNLYNILEVARD